MYITVTRTISMGHRLPSYRGVCSSPHGHNVRVEVQIVEGDERFLDFKEVDAALAQVLKDLDHAMVLHVEDPLVEALKPFNFRVVLLNVEPTTEAIADMIHYEMHQLGFTVVYVVVHETDKYSAKSVALKAESSKRARREYATRQVL